MAQLFELIDRRKTRIERVTVIRKKFRKERNSFVTNMAIISFRNIFSSYKNTVIQG
jgi:hypothetical protein